MPKKTVDKKIFSIDELKPKKHYRIKVKSFDKDKKLIGESPWIIFKTTGKNQAPPNVSNLDADFKGSALIVTWNGSDAREEKDFKEFRIKISSPDHPGIIKNFYSKDDKFNFNEDLNRKVFGSFEGTINVTVYSRDTSDNESSGVSVSAFADVPEDPTNVKLSAAVLGYNVSWDLPTFKNYDYTKIYQSTSESGTYSVVRNERGSSTYVPRNNLSEIWVKVSHVNKAGAESNLVVSVPPSITPIDPVPTDVTPPAVPSNLNWEDAGTESINGITTAAMRAHWEVSEITSGYKVRVTEDIVNKDNWAVYDVPASRATVTFKSVSSNVATLTLSAHSFAKDDYVTIFNMGSPFDGKRKITSVTSNTISFSLTTGDVASTATTGDVVISSYTVKELYPGTSYYGAILAYDSANNLTQFVSEGTFATSGTAATVGSKITISGTTMAFGPDVSGTNDGLFINSNNYWYNTGLFNVGTASNSLSWDGVRLRLDGSIVARSGSFSGNVFLAGENLENDTTGSLIATPYLNIQSATWSGGIATIVTNTNPSPAWSAGDIVIISEASKQFDGEYILLSATDNTFTFSMTGYSSVSSITNVGKMARVNTGDRVIFNSSGIQGWEDDSIAFSFNRNKTSRIGGWTIRPAKLFGGAGSSYVGLASTGTWRIWAGNEDPSIAPFRLSGSGNIRAYGLFSSSDVDSGTRISIGSDVSGDKDGIVINDTTNSGIENFWYVPSGVDNGSAYFKVGTSAGSGITVIKTANNTSRVKIKDYDIEGVATIVEDSKVTIDNIGGSSLPRLDRIEIGRDAGEQNRNGIAFVGKNSSGNDIVNNYWTVNDNGGGADFRVGGSGTKYIQYTQSDDTLTVSGNINVLGGNAATTSQLAAKLDSSAFTGINILSAVNGGPLNDLTGNGISIGNNIVSGQVYPRIATVSHLTYSDTGAGFFLGRDTDGQYKFFVGDGGANKDSLSWNGTALVVKGNLRTNDTDKTRVSIQTGDDAAKIKFFWVSDIEPEATPRAGTSAALPAVMQISEVTTSGGNTGLGWLLKSGARNGDRVAPFIKMETSATESNIRLEVPTDNGKVIVEGKDFDIATETVTFSNLGTVFNGIGTKNSPVGADYVLGKTTASNSTLRWFPVSALGGSGGTTYTSGDSDLGIKIDNTNDTILNAGYRKVGNTLGWTNTRGNERNRITFGGDIPTTDEGRSDGDIHIEF